MKKTIAFLKYTPLTKKTYEDCCMESLINGGYSVEYWDTTSLYKFTLGSFEHLKVDKVLIRTIRSYDELTSLAKQKVNTLYISLMTPGLNQVRLLNTIAVNNSIIAFWGPDPIFYKKNAATKRIKRITIGKIVWMFKHYCCRLFFRYMISRNYDYYFKVGNKGYQSLGSIDERTKRAIKPLLVNSFDYDRYKYNNLNITCSAEKNAVFIDQYYPFHPDMTIMGTSHIPSEPYYRQLNATFNIIEKELGVKVLIAAHPKSLKYKDKNFFNGRKVYMGMTADLIKNASYVIIHDSTALSFAIMNYKPVIALTSSLIKKYYPENYNNCVNLSEQFGFTLINMDNIETIKSFLQHNLNLLEEQINKYNSYIYNYCTSPELHKSNKELIIEYIEKMYN